MIKGKKGFQKGHQHSEETKQRIGNALRRVVTYNCDYCSKVCFTKPSVFSTKKRHFCSIQCYADYRRELLSKEEHNSYGSGLPIEERKLRAWCRSTANHALQQGLVKKEQCRICGQEAEMHHPDYRLPLGIIWYCFDHHRELHRTLS
ncbi:hypothetical protein LCGC14_2773480 [marine sediment metagenome]|uniref:Uncharacterized protein n=1 Tax=marine sediment metagenome TaxID=412755 RepID=A0A0F8YVI7_9ZZZZ